MNTKYFLGLTFYQDNSFARSIENFRKRFDSKYQTNATLHLALVPSFEIETKNKNQLAQELTEELESFFFENTSYQNLNFTGIDVYEYKKNKILYLNPKLSQEMILCQESLSSICKSYHSDREAKINNQKSFLTIGRFQDPFELHSAIQMAQNEFDEISSLPFQSICLFEKKNGIWYRDMDLIRFDKPNNLIINSTGLKE